MTDRSDAAVSAQASPGSGQRADELAARVSSLDAASAAALLSPELDELVVAVLRSLVPSLAREVLAQLDPSRRQRLLAAATAESRRQWTRQLDYPEDSVGRLMEAPLGVFGPERSVAEATAELRELVKRAFITYAFVVDPQGRLLGVITMRDLLFAPPKAQLGEVMLREPFHLRPDTPLMEAMRQVLHRHYPVYPVCDGDGLLVGLVRGQDMFEQQAIELSAQPGAMVGVGKEERLATPLLRCLKFRHPWLQLNIFTAFIAAAVVGFFQDTIDRLVVLAAFLPVLAGQSGNTGCQALAVALRGLTLGEFKSGDERRLVLKEASLGLANGFMVGITAAIGMYIYASMQEDPHALALSGVVLVAMSFSCVISGISGTLVPVILQRLGADPATASSIFLTTATDVASMGFLLGLATWLV